MSAVTDTLSNGITNLSQGFGNFNLSRAMGTQNNYQTALDPGQQVALANSIVGSQGNLGQIYGQQNQLAGMLSGVANGTGPNPGQIMLNQATNQNAQNAAGAIASTKGINPALAARLINQNATNTNQVAAGQGALMQANQSLGAMGHLGNLYGQMGNQQIGNIQAAGGVLNQTQAINSDVAKNNAAANANMYGGLMSGAGTAAAAFLAKGGMVENVGKEQYSHAIPMKKTGPSSFACRYMAEGGAVEPESDDDSEDSSEGKKSGKSIADNHQSFIPTPTPGLPMSRGGQVPGHAPVPGNSYANDQVPTMLSPEEIVIPRSITMGPDAPRRAALFVAQELAKKKQRK